MGKLIGKFFQTITTFSPSTKKFLKDFFVKIFKKLFSFLKSLFKNPRLAGGVSFIGLSSYFYSQLKDSVYEKFNFIGDVLQIDVLFSRLDAFDFSSLNMSFSQALTALGLVGALNVILQNVGLMIAVWVFLFLMNFLMFVLGKLIPG